MDVHVHLNVVIKDVHLHLEKEGLIHLIGPQEDGQFHQHVKDDMHLVQ